LAYLCNEARITLATVGGTAAGGSSSLFPQLISKVTSSALLKSELGQRDINTGRSDAGRPTLAF